jgi:hypothetical protein
MYNEDVQRELKGLIGKNASAIVYTNLQFYDATQIAAVLEAAMIIRDTPYYLGTWLLCAIGEDGTTEWRAPNGRKVGIVTSEGTVLISDSNPQDL